MFSRTMQILNGMDNKSRRREKKARVMMKSIPLFVIPQPTLYGTLDFLTKFTDEGEGVRARARV